MNNLNINMVDYHCHLDLYPNYKQAFKECAENNIITFAVTTTPKAWPKNKELSIISPNIRLGLGFHPQLISERYTEFTLFEKYFSETKFIGEIGLDASPQFYKSFSLQLQFFEKIISMCANFDGKILSIHSVRTNKEVLNIIEKYLPINQNRVILHWFNGTKSEIERAIKLGCYFSINHVMLKKEDKKKIIASIPQNRIITETDGPFIKLHEQSSRLQDIKITIQELAKIYNIEETQMQKQILTNLFSIENEII